MLAECTYSPREILVVNNTQLEADCERDADCTEHAYGYCADGINGFAQTAPRCAYGCVSDSDCGAGKLCLCGDPVGRCVPASCTTDEDCGEGLCAGTPNSESCTGLVRFSFACQSPEDACRTQADCSVAGDCVVGDGPRRCVDGAPCGRPFLVQGVARTAEAAATSAWNEPTTLETQHLDLETRRALADHWTELGLMEHASVAAFARFSLELLALGAPAELLESAQGALADEIAHARLCFGLASAYAAAPLGPSALSFDGALHERSRLEIVRTAFLEACVGETLAAVEAASLSEHATDPVVRAALDRIAQDEARHAELGFRFVKWALDSVPLADRLELEHEISTAVAQELARTFEPPSDAVDRLEHGVASERIRRETRRIAFAEVIVPCVRALVGPMRAAA